MCEYERVETLRRNISYTRRWFGSEERESEKERVMRNVNNRFLAKNQM